jgi:hypothetical protein
MFLGLCEELMTMVKKMMKKEREEDEFMGFVFCSSSYSSY